MLYVAGDIGTVIEDDGSGKPFHVRASSGATWWYKAAAIERTDGVGAVTGQRVDSSNITIGLRVKRGPDWRYGDQDGGGAGKILGWVTLDGTKFGSDPSSNGWARVEWDSGRTDAYEIGADGDYCLSVAESTDPSNP